MYINNTNWYFVQVKKKLQQVAKFNNMNNLYFFKLTIAKSNNYIAVDVHLLVNIIHKKLIYSTVKKIKN